MPEPESLTDAAARSILHPLSRGLLLLTVTTGVVDAVSFLGLGRVFTANMTGNVVFLGFGIAGSGGLPVLAPIVSLAAFAIGARAGAVLSGRLEGRYPAQIAVPLAAEVTLIVVAALLAAAIDVRPGDASGYVLIALLAIAMGVRNAAVRRLAVPDVNTTVLTGTITALAANLTLLGGTGQGTTRRVAAVVAMFVGALVGALLLRTSLWLALLGAVAIGFATLIAFAVQRVASTST
jgi:uncharacterized membrane protein YoaK (UPF0700 family)